MAVVVDMVFDDMTNAEYDAVMAATHLEGASADRIPGLIAHFAFEQNGTLRAAPIR